MCGICGIVGRPDRTLLERMCRALVHRGPDDQGLYLGERAGLGMRRLSVVDPAGGRQPMSDERQKIFSVYNGEIYNFKEVREDLRRKGHYFYTESDSEIIPHAYEEYGPDCVARFNGMFAFAVWDETRQELFLARDRLGIKPLYTLHDGESFLFASEIKALLQDPRFRRRMDPAVLYEFLGRKYVPGDRTMFAGIRSLPPGCWLKYRNGRTQIREYWRPAFSPKLSKSDDEYGEDIYELLKASVRKRLLSDVSLGVFLGGGMDSGGIAALMTRLGGPRVRTFSLGFDPSINSAYAQDELEDARALAARLGTEHREYVLRGEDLLRELPRICWQFDQPYAGSVPQYFLSRFAKKDVTVALSGLGGDELFGNYGRGVRLEKWLGPWVLWAQHLPGLERSRLLSAFLDRLPNGVWADRLKGKVRAALQPGFAEPVLYDRMLSVFDPEMRRALCTNSPMMRASHPDSGDPVERVRRLFQESGAKERLDKIFFADMRTELVSEYLCYGDALTMAHSLEMRLPYLDHELVEYAARIPARLRGRPGKHLLKLALARVLPQEVLDRPKTGFSLPYPHWLRTDLREVAEHFLSARRLKEQGCFAPEAVRRLLREHWRGDHDHHSAQIWSLLMFQLWHWLYLERGCARAADVPELSGLRPGRGRRIRREAPAV